MTVAPASQCRARGCRVAPAPVSLYGRCDGHMWCEHCSINEVIEGRLCSSCKGYRRRRGRARPRALIEAQDHRNAHAF